MVSLRLGCYSGDARMLSHPRGGEGYRGVRGTRGARRAGAPSGVLDAVLHELGEEGGGDAGRLVWEGEG